jgi:rod shape-determining protein MreC
MFDKLKENRLSNIGLVFLISILCLWLEKKNHLFYSTRSTMTLVISPIQEFATYTAKELRLFFEGYFLLLNVQKQYIKISVENEKLKNQLIDYELLKKELRLLKENQKIIEKQKELQMIPAQIISRPKNDFLQTMRLLIKIPQSLDQMEIKVNMPVIAQGFVIGKIHKIKDQYAEIMLLNDVRSSVNIVLEYSRIQGLLLGQGAQENYLARLNDMQRKNKMLLGERAITTGDDGIFPAGLCVGVLNEILPQNQGLFYEGKIKPLISVDQLAQVWIVVNHPSFEFKDKLEQLFPPEDKK